MNLQETIEKLRKKVYLLSEKEVILTGRTASKMNRGKRTSTLLFETTPLNPNEHNKKWVRLDELYEIHHSQAPPRSEDLIAAIRRAVEKGKITND